MELKLVSGNSTIAVADAVFGCEFKEPLIHQVVTSYLTNARAGTKAQKTRAEVRGGGAKPWKQKGTGRARAGTIRSPLWRSGGIVFAAKPRDFTQKINKKMYHTAMRSILSELIRQERLLLVNEFVVKSNKTKDLVQQLKDLGLTKALIVVENVERNLYLASRNLHKIDVRDVMGVDPVSLVGFEKVLITVPALKKLEEKLQ